MTTAAAAQDPVPWRSWYTLAVMLTAYVLAFMDRQMLNLLVQPIKQSLGLSDTQISLLQGFAFALALSLVALPLGRLIDTRRRTAILAAGVAVWSLMTAGCGVAASFPLLLLMRAGVAGGEAAMTPTALSIIGDAFPPRRIGIATGGYALGVHLGSGLALIVGALLLKVANTSHVSLPGLGSLSGWRLVFVVMGVVGAPVALWVALLHEPRRGGAAAAAQPIVSWPEVLRFLRRHGWTQACANLAVGFALMANYGVSAWAPAFFARRFGWGPSAFGAAYGPLTILFGISGVLAASALGDRWRARGVLDARFRIMAITALAAAPLLIAAPLAPTAAASLLLFAAAGFLNAAAVGSGPAVLQEIAPPRLRGITHALALLTVNLIALGLGPTSVALVTDYVLHDERHVGIALAWVAPAALLVAAGFSLAGGGPFRRLLQTRS